MCPAMISIMAIKAVLTKNHLQRMAAVVFALLVWQAAAMLVNESLLLASPLQVAGRLFSLVGTADFWAAVMHTGCRIVLGFLAGFAAGIGLAIAAGRFKWVEMLLWPFVVTIKTIPVASFVILVLIWLGSRQLSVFISFLMVFPVIYLNTLQGIQSTDTKLLEMAAMFRLTGSQKLRHIYLPHLRPFLTGGCSIALGLSWKSGVAAELIGRPDASMGDMLYMAKIHFDTSELFAWTFVIILLSLLFEKLFLYGLKACFEKAVKG